MGYGSGSRSGGVKPEPPNLAVKQRRKGWNVKVFIMQRDYNAWLRALYGEYHRRPFCTRKRFGLASTSKVCVEWGGGVLESYKLFRGFRSCGLVVLGVSGLDRGGGHGAGARPEFGT